MSITDKLKKIAVATGIAASVFAGAKARAQNYPTNMNSKVGDNISVFNDFNKDGQKDIFGCDVSRTQKGYKLDCWYNLTYWEKNGGTPYNVGVFEVPEGTCVDIAEKGDKVTRLWDVSLLKYPCEDYSKRTRFAYFKNTGSGFKRTE